jgi:hypothetical protein
VTSEVPVYQVFSDDPSGTGSKPISDHMRSVMDDLVGALISVARLMLIYAQGTFGSSVRKQLDIHRRGRSLRFRPGLLSAGTNGQQRMG